MEQQIIGEHRALAEAELQGFRNQLFYSKRTHETIVELQERSDASDA